MSVPSSTGSPPRPPQTSIPIPVSPLFPVTTGAMPASPLFQGPYGFISQGTWPFAPFPVFGTPAAQVSSDSFVPASAAAQPTTTHVVLRDEASSPIDVVDVEQLRKRKRLLDETDGDSRPKRITLEKHVASRKIEKVSRLEALNRSLQVINQQLELAKTESDEKFQQLKQFFLSIIHDIKNELNADLCFLEQDTPDIPSAITCIRSSAHFLEDNLDLEKGELTLHKTNFHLGKELTNAFEVARRSVQKQDKKISYSFHIDTDVPELLYGDVGKLGRIIKNLLTNSFKYTLDGGEIKIFVTKDAIKPSCYRFIVVDTGKGIPSEQKEKFGQRFGIDSQGEKGFGVGLSACAHLVSLMQGTFKLIDTPELRFQLQNPHQTQGCCIEFTMHLEEAKMDLVSKDELALDKRFKLLPKLTMIFADDMPVIRMAYANKKKKEAKKHDAKFVENGHEAIKELQHYYTGEETPTHPPVLLLDNDMPLSKEAEELQTPRIDGIEAAKILRKWEKEKKINPRPIIILVSGGVSLSEEDKALFDRVLEKPFKWTKFVKFLESKFE